MVIALNVADSIVAQALPSRLICQHNYRHGGVERWLSVLDLIGI